MTTVVDTLQQIIRHELRSLHIAELGLVEAVFPHSDGGDDDNYACDVRLKDSGLLLRRVPVMTGHIGTVAIPNVGDLVLLNFEQGDVNHALIVGRFYNNIDRPPLNNPNEIIFRLPLAEAGDKSILAAIRNLPANQEPREIIVEMPPQITVRISDGAVRATAGDTEMILDQPHSSGGRVTVVTGRTKIVMNQDGDVRVDVAGSLTVKADRDLTLEANGDVAIKGMNVKAEATMNAEVKGGLAATLRGDLSATVQGTNLSLRGLASFSP